jgi:hypothetical protein
VNSAALGSALVPPGRSRRGGHNLLLSVAPEEGTLVATFGRFHQGDACNLNMLQSGNP